MPCSCGGMRRSGLAPSNIAIKHKQPNEVYKRLPQYIQVSQPLLKPETPPQQKQAPPPPPQQKQAPPPQQKQAPPPPPQPITYQSNRPNFSGNLPRRR